MRKVSILILLLTALLLSFCKQTPSDESQVVIPFEFVKNQILVEVFVEHSGPYKMIFDTGVTPSSIDIEIARKLNIPIDSSKTGFASGRGNAKIQLFPAKITAFRMGTIQIDSLEAVTLDNKFIGKALGKPLLGILGYSFLKDRIFKIDYQKKEIYIFNSREELNKTFQGKTTVKEEYVYQKDDIIPIIKNIKINDKPFIASLDTGSSLSFEIFQHHIDTYEIETDTSKTYQITGARGSDKNIRVVIPKFALGNKIFHNIESGVAGIKDTLQLRQGNIGNGFLKQFKVSFDYINKEVIFENY